MDESNDYQLSQEDSPLFRDLGGVDPHRPPERDIEITGVAAMALAGNFTWGIVVVETDAGVRGIGETHVIREAVDVVNSMESHIIGQNPLDIRRIREYLYDLYPGAGSIGQAAIAGIETALWDLKGKLLEVPVYELLGGTYRNQVRVYNDTHGGASLGTASGAESKEVYSPESYARAAQEVVDDGFSALKFDLDVIIDSDIDTASRRLDNGEIEHKVALIDAVRDQIGYEIDLAVDLHWAFSIETATRLGRKLDQFDLAWIEDPVPTEKVDAHRYVADQLDTPILTGENVVRIEEMHRLLEADALSIAAPDINMCGGLDRLQAIAELCNLYDVPLAPHNVSSPIGTIAGVHLCATIPNFLALEYHAREVPWWSDLVNRTDNSQPIIEDGSITLPEGPGLGIEIDPKVAEQHLVDGCDLVV